MALGLLWRAHLRARRRRHLALATAFAAGLLAILVLSTVVEDAQRGLLAPLAATTTGDLRVTQGDDDLAAGTTWEDARPVVSQLRERTGGAVSMRFEAAQILVDEGDPDAWTGGVLYGIDTADTAEQDALRRLLVWGSLPGREAIAPDGRSRVPVVVGEEAARRLGIDLGSDGAPDFDVALRVTSGRFGDRDALPLHADAVVVGVFRSGVAPLDRFTVYAPIEAARQLAGHGPIDPVANAILIRGGDVAAGKSWAAAEGLETTTPAGFGRHYLGAVVVAVELIAWATVAAVLLILGSWLVQETVAAVHDDRRMLGSLASIGMPRGLLVWSYASVNAAAVGVAGACALLVLITLQWAPSVAVPAPGLDLTLAWSVPPWAWWLAPAVATASLLVAAGAAWRGQRGAISDALRTP